uniref:Uncharacterized protein n=1 Tax=Rhizophora mucronata TaxID=61149 RepID=A0A2P2PMU1_RHIMU
MEGGDTSAYTNSLKIRNISSNSCILFLFRDNVRRICLGTSHKTPTLQPHLFFMAKKLKKLKD